MLFFLSRVQVVVMPIFWEERGEEKASVLEAVERVEKVLADAGAKSSIDTNNKYMPGQRMKYW